ncbi:MAG: capsule assembly Wzi family protein [Balneolaceae bacterium]|nr:capsule assembly Wzi family protein [Balneolaceae bacterium]
MSSFKKCTGVFVVVLVLLLPYRVFAQSIPVGNLLDEQAVLQTLLSDSITVGTVNRPFSAAVYHTLLGNTDQDQSKWWNRNLLTSQFSLGNDVNVGLLPTFVQNTVNSKIPYGENNQAAWYGRGSNIELKGGFYVTSKFLTVNFNPHIIYQENLDFRNPRFIFRDENGDIRYVAEGIQAQLDAPFRFGPDPFTTVDPGNSSFRLHYKKFETGISTEPLWWGPAVRYPLVFSNNAAGIPHFFFKSRQPVDIPYFGDLQFRWILGYPQESKYYDGKGEGNTRFTNSVNVAYRPFFFKNLTIGITRVYHLYEEGGFSFSNVGIIFNPLSSSTLRRTDGGNDVRQVRNQTASIYLHLSIPEANAEIYGELYREDHSYNTRDFINEPHHNGAYLFGFQKLSYFPWVDFIKTNLEFTNLTVSQLEQVRFQTNIYTHSQIRQGHTNKGQILGAAIGPGSNSQYLSIDAYKDDYKFGIFAQRWVDNDNFHFQKGSADLAPSDQFGDYFRHRVNLNFGLNLLYGPGPFYLNGKFMWTKAFNYGRFDYGEFEGVTVRNYEHKDLINIQYQIGITYIF